MITVWLLQAVWAQFLPGSVQCVGLLQPAELPAGEQPVRDGAGRQREAVSVREDGGESALAEQDVGADPIEGQFQRGAQADRQGAGVLAAPHAQQVQGEVHPADADPDPAAEDRAQARERAGAQTQEG